MKKLILILVGAMLVACQHTDTRTVVTTAAKPQKTTANTAPPIINATLPLLFAANDTLTPTMRSILQAHDLSALWKNPKSDYNLDPVFEGFFGPDHYRFELVFTEVSRDAQNPAIYHLAGKTHYRKNIRSFTGTLTVRQVNNLKYPGFLQAMAIRNDEAKDSLGGHTYTARAQLQLREEQAENSGIFEGEALLDFYTLTSGEADYVTTFDREGINELLPTRGGRMLLKGNRLNISTQQIKPFEVAPWLTGIAPDIFKDFMLDERMGEINPKYAKLGWNEKWGNEEWWAEPGKPSLNL